MQPFPLFTNLAALASQKNATTGAENITESQQIELVNCLKQLNKDQIEHVTVLIIHYFIVKYHSTSGSSQHKEIKARLKSNKVPNVIKTGSAKKGFSIDLNDLPLELQSILCQYCRIS